MDTTLKTELKYLAIRSVFINIAVYLLSFIVCGINISVLLGLILGTVAMLLNMVMLYSQVSKAVWLEGSKKTSAKVFGGYILRMAVMCLFIWIAIKSGFISWIGVAIPLIYPRLIYTTDAIFQKTR